MEPDKDYVTYSGTQSMNKFTMSAEFRVQSVTRGYVVDCDLKWHHVKSQHRINSRSSINNLS